MKSFNNEDDKIAFKMDMRLSRTELLQSLDTMIHRIQLMRHSLISASEQAEDRQGRNFVSTRVNQCDHITAMMSQFQQDIDEIIAGTSRRSDDLVLAVIMNLSNALYFELLGVPG